MPEIYDYDAVTQTLRRVSVVEEVAEVVDGVAKKPTVACYSCQTRLPKESAKQSTLSGSRYYCAPCHKATFAECATCAKDVMLVGRGSSVRTKCPSMETVNNHYGSADIWGYKKYCTDCYSDGINSQKFQGCGECGNVFDSTFITMRAVRRGTYCPYCIECRRAQMRGIMGYTTDVLMYLDQYDQPKDNLLMGVELEVQSIRATGDFNLSQANHTRNLLTDFAICKSDSSIGEYGFEIVTVPASIDGHRKEWAKFFANPPKVTSWKSGQCGMHVHINRKALTSLQIGKMQVFINSPYNVPLLYDVAGRINDQYCKTDTNKTLTSHRGVGTGRQARHDTRYEALNVTNEATVEVRIFRGTMKPESFFKNLEFVHSLVKFTHDASLSAMTTPAYLAWLTKNRLEYPHLVAFLQRKKIIDGHEDMVKVWDAPNKRLVVTPKYAEAFKDI